MGDDEERCGPAYKTEASKNLDSAAPSWGEQGLSCICHWACLCQPCKCSWKSGSTSKSSSWAAALSQDVRHRDQIWASSSLRGPRFPAWQCKDAAQKHLPRSNSDQRGRCLEDLRVWILPCKLSWARPGAILAIPWVWPWPATRNLSSGWNP